MTEGGVSRRAILGSLSSVLACREFATKSAAAATESASPNAEFVYTPSVPAPGEAVSFDGIKSTGDISDYSWEIELDSGLTYESGREMSHSWDDSGTYTVTLTVTESDGSTDSTSRNVDVGDGTVDAQFSYSPPTPSVDDRVYFDGTATDEGAVIERYEWEFENSSSYDDSEYGPEPSYTWETDGRYQVTLTAIDDEGVSDSETKEVSVGNVAPEASFSVTPSTPSPDEEVTLDGTLSNDEDGTIDNYEWEIENSSQYADSAYRSETTYAWDTGGSFDVTLTVTDNGGKTDAVTETVTVENSPPVPDFSVSPSAPVPDEEVTLDATLSTDADGTIDNYEWDIENSSQYADSAYESQTTYAWDTGGSFDVTLTVTDNGGASESVTKTVTVENTAPDPEFAYRPSIPESGEEVTLDGTLSEDTDGSIESYEWEIENSSQYTDNALGSETTYEWDTDGSYDVTLTVTDNGGKSDSVTESISVGNTAPRADISISPADPDVGESVTFDASGTTDPENNVESFTWDIVGGTETGETATHTFESSGEYTVTLTVTDTKGATDEATETLFVGNRPPSPSISYSPSDVTTNTTVTFDGSGSTDPDGSIVEYRWTFPDGSTATGETVEHSFSESKEQLSVVELAVEDDGGKVETVTEMVEVAPATPTAATETASPTASATRTEGPSPTAKPSTQTRTPTAAPSNPTRTPTSGADGNDDDGSLLPFALGALGLGGGAVLYRQVRSDGDGQDEDGQPLGGSPADGSGGSTADDSGGPSADGSGGSSPAPGADYSTPDRDQYSTSGDDSPSESPSETTSGDTSTESVSGDDSHGTAAASDSGTGGGEPPSGPSSGAKGNAVPEEIPTAPEATVDYEALTDEHLIGNGGNADVYRATLPGADGDLDLAIKRPRMSGTLRIENVERMLEEAKTWDDIDDHDHVVSVVDYGAEPLPWIAMEYMDGDHLGERVDGMNTEQALWTAIAVSDGIHHAHRQGVAHLDLKPENILFRTVEDAWDVPKVADWGLSKHLHEHSKSVEGMSPQYAAPEQFDEEFGGTDDITDVYQLGAVFYELFTGRPPFEGRPTQVMRAVLDDQVRPPSEVATVPEGLDDVLLTALAKERDDRYESVVLMKNDLRELYESVDR